MTNIGDEEEGAPDFSGMDVGDLLAQAREMQDRILEAQQFAAAQEVTGSAAGGKVTVTITGGMEVRSLRISHELVDPDAVDVLEDTVVAALRDAVTKAAQVNQEAFDEIGPGPDIPTE